MKAVLIRYASHRMAHRVQTILGRHPQTWFSFTLPNQYLDVTEAEFETVKDIPGVRRSRVDRMALSRTWDI